MPLCVPKNTGAANNDVRSLVIAKHPNFKVVRLFSSHILFSIFLPLFEHFS